MRVRSRLHHPQWYSLALQALGSYYCEHICGAQHAHHLMRHQLRQPCTAEDQARASSTQHQLPESEQYRLCDNEPHDLAERVQALLCT